ncbi:pyridoxamine 5'-phosphate oxidase family protein [Actinomadura sp. 3N407]|uniref:pyridoxamine 5'-phosphate oxidase family protein n=1 Tax=Actinomadura sp. 3N407 TaxID=3457423 RepID=UPI003FCEB366
MPKQTPVAEALTPTGKGTGVTPGAGVLDWSEVERRFTQDGWRWLATVRPDGAPHVMPVFGAWSESVLFVVSKATARKSRNLDVDGRCVLSADVEGAHLVVEGDASRVLDEETLERASAAFERVYGWPTTIAGAELDADYGAPTSGGPPYRVYQIVPSKVFALPSAGDFMPTRWRFT